MDPVERTPSQSPAALGVRDVYGAWKDFAFEATVAAYQPVCEKVIANSEKGVTDKQELVTFVRTFAASVQGKESVPVKEIEGVLAFFKGAFARVMERASYGEAQFNSLFGAVGRLPDPTPMLSKASVLAATVQKLEVELAAASEDGTEAQSLRERLRAEGRAAAAAFAERDAFEALTRKLGGEVEALETAAAAHRQAAREMGERNHDLENRYLVVSEELSTLQAAREAGGDALQDEVLRLTQQLADRGFEAAALQRRLEAAEAAAEAAAAAAGGDTAEQTLLLHERRWQEEVDKCKAEAAAAAAELEEQLAAKGRELDEARRSGALLADPAAELDKRRARVRRLVAELGDVGDGCLAQLGAPNAAAAAAAGREALAAAEDEVDVVLALKARVKALSAAARTTHTALQAEARAAAAAAEAAAERSGAQLAEMEAKVARMRGRLAAIGDPTEAAAAAAGDVGEAPAGVADAAAFDISSLVPDASHVSIDVSCSGGAAEQQEQPTMVKVLAAQRDALRERVAELEKDNHAARQEQQRLQRLYAGAVDTAGRAAMPLERRVGSPAGPGSVKGKGGASGAAGSLPLLDAFSTKTVQLLNSNIYTRRFAVCYVLLLHLLVSSTLWHAAFSGMSEHTKKSQHSF